MRSIYYHDELMCCDELSEVPLFTFYKELSSKCVAHLFYKLLTFIYRKDHEKAEFEVHEVYAVDVLVSTGEGKVSVLSRLFSPFLHYS